jgi:hypothetical protein
MRLTCLCPFPIAPTLHCAQKKSASMQLRRMYDVGFPSASSAASLQWSLRPPPSPTNLAHLQALSIEPSEMKLLRLEKQQRTAADMPNVVEKPSLTQSSSTSKNRTTTKLQMIDWNRIVTLPLSIYPIRDTEVLRHLLLALSRLSAFCTRSRMKSQTHLDDLTTRNDQGSKGTISQSESSSCRSRGSKRVAVSTLSRAAAA